MHTCCDTILTLFIPPLGYWCKTKRYDIQFLISLILMISTLDIAAPIYTFFTYGMDLCVAVLCLFLPPLGVLFGHGGCCEVIICIILTLCGIFPGIIYAYHLCMSKVDSSQGFRS